DYHCYSTNIIGNHYIF
nr:immunoglobulin light chain junction region [Macaca mulatta]